MRYYIATKLERHAEHNQVRDLMARFGHQITYDWTAHGPVWRDGADRIREVSELEMKGVVTADLVIVLLPGGRGTHAELGMALARGKRVLLHSCDPVPLGAAPETCAFYHHPLCLGMTGSFEVLATMANNIAKARLHGPRDPEERIAFVEDPGIESLAIKLYEHDGMDGRWPSAPMTSWNAQSEEDREIYRRLARGQDPYANTCGGR
jgi:hypothetical protein